METWINMKHMGYVCKLNTHNDRREREYYKTLKPHVTQENPPK